ncbi:MAG: hypothetical protein B7X67_17490 [Rhizobiales bacterium 39-66-18]|nr:MAG: hypothetical protein B7X67_17490 [Rhizobiales bacterium 39-66-18]
MLGADLDPFGEHGDMALQGFGEGLKGLGLRPALFFQALQQQSDLLRQGCGAADGAHLLRQVGEAGGQVRKLLLNRRAGRISGGRFVQAGNQVARGPLHGGAGDGDPLDHILADPHEIRAGRGPKAGERAALFQGPGHQVLQFRNLFLQARQGLGVHRPAVEQVHFPAQSLHCGGEPVPALTALAIRENPEAQLDIIEICREAGRLDGLHLAHLAVQMGQGAADFPHRGARRGFAQILAQPFHLGAQGLDGRGGEQIVRAFDPAAQFSHRIGLVDRFDAELSGGCFQTVHARLLRLGWGEAKRNAGTRSSESLTRFGKR